MAKPHLARPRQRAYAKKARIGFNAQHPRYQFDGYARAGASTTTTEIHNESHSQRARGRPRVDW